MAAKFLPPSKLITAIRTSTLVDVIDALDNGANVEEADMHGFVGLPLRTACFEGNIDIVRELLTRGADINAIAGDGPGAPIRLAQRGKHQHIVELLIEHGATVTPNPKILAESTALFPPQTLVQASGEGLEPTGEKAPPTPEEAVAMVPETKSPLELEFNQAVTDNLIEYTPTTIPESSIEELDLTACYGVDTNLLDFDLQRLRDEQDVSNPEAESTNPEKPKSKFWNSSTDK